MNEKTLIKLMKAAYKGGGVKVWRSPKDVLYLCGPGWACGMLWKYVPGPVLGLVASWCHGLPEKGQGWWCLKDCGEDPESVNDIPEPLATLLRHHVELSPGLFVINISYMGYQAAQCHGMSILWFESDGIAMLGRLANFGGDFSIGPDINPWGRWHDPETGTVLFLEAVDRVRPDLTDKLSEIDYRKPGGGGHERV